MIHTVQRTGTIPLRYSRGIVLSAEESVGTVLSADFLPPTGPLISTLRGLAVQRTSNFRQ